MLMVIMFFCLLCFLLDETWNISHGVYEGCVLPSLEVLSGEVKDITIGLLHEVLLVCVHLKLILQLLLLLLNIFPFDFFDCLKADLLLLV